MNVSIKNLTVVLKTISILFIHLQSRFTWYFNKKRKNKKQKQSCFKQTILKVQTLCKRQSDVSIVCVEQFLPVAGFQTCWTSACRSYFYRGRKGLMKTSSPNSLNKLYKVCPLKLSKLWSYHVFLRGSKNKLDYLGFLSSHTVIRKWYCHNVWMTYFLVNLSSFS